MPELKVIPVDRIKVPDVRVSSILDEEQKALMASTIEAVGVVQDPVVRALPDGSFELIAGKSRIQELVAQGATEVPVKVIEADEKMGLIMNIVENVARGSYDYVSIAQAIRRLRQMGVTPAELERIFPWKARWIQFVEELQDLPDDVQAAIRARKLTPTHVQVALQMPTAYEAHDALKTAVNLEWDSGTLRTYVQNRVDQIEAAKAAAAALGEEPDIPPADPVVLTQYTQCLLCGYKKPRDQVTMQHVCDGCRDLVGYITAQLGPSEEAINQVYAALQAYAGRAQALPGAPPRAPGGPAPA